MKKNQQKKGIGIVTITILLCILNSFTALSKNTTDLLEETVRFYSHYRLNNGLYLDRLSLTSTEHPGVVSISSTGVGLLSEVIAWQTGLQTRNETISQWEQTLNFLTSNPSMLYSQRAGFYDHFYDSYGHATGNDFSTVDNAILQICLFWGAEKINDPGISATVLQIFNNTNWPVTCYGSEYIYRKIDKDGTGSYTSSSFNEYCLVAWLASLQSGENSLQQSSFTHYIPGESSTVNTFNYEGIDLITDWSWQALSSFVPLFSWFFCPQLHEALFPEIQHYQQADSLFFYSELNSKNYYGCGSGSGYSSWSGYSVEEIGSNTNAIVSPSTLAGYGICNNYSYRLLDRMADEGKGRYQIPGTSDSILWRFSLIHGNFATEVQSIDMANLLLGLAFKELGDGFFEFEIPVVEKELSYNAYNVMDNLTDLEISADGKIFFVNNDSCFYKNGEQFVNVSLADDVNDITLTENNLYAACDDHIYRVPLNNLSSVYTEDTWTWDEFTQLLVRTNNAGQAELFYFINSFGSRSGWTYRFANGTRNNFTWGHYYYDGFLDHENDSLAYIARATNSYLRYNVISNKYDSLRTNIKYSGLSNGHSILMNNSGYSTDHGSSWINYTFPEGITGISSSGLCQVNDSTFAIANSTTNTIFLLTNGTLHQTSTQIPTNFFLKDYHPATNTFWGFISQSYYSPEGILVSVPLNRQLKNNMEVEDIETCEFFSDSAVQVQISAEARFGNIHYESQNPEVATVDIQGKSTFLRGGQALIKVRVNETEVYEGAEAMVLAVANHNVIIEEEICDRDATSPTVSSSETEYLSVDGLDSIIHVTRYTHPEYYLTEEVEICEGNSYNGHSSTGTYYQYYSTVEGGCDSTIETRLVVNERPPQPVITVNGSLLTSSAQVGNQWYFEGEPVTGGSKEFLTADNSGYYSVLTTSEEGCSSEMSNPVFVTGLSSSGYKNSFVVYPNPVSDVVYIKRLPQNDQVQITVFNCRGERIKTKTGFSSETFIDLSAELPGIYLVEICGEKFRSVKLVEKSM